MNNICILGFGLSTLCFTLYLVDNNLINNFSKIIILDKNTTICQNSLRYRNVNSNSTLKSMLSIFKNKIFSEALCDIKKTYNLDTYINLYEYNLILQKLCNIYLDYLTRNKTFTIRFNYLVNKIEKYNNIYKINNDITVTKIIIAMGGSQSLDYYKFKDIDNILHKINKNKIILSNNLYTSNKIDYLNNKNLLIIGSSHSVFSIIDLILKYNINYKSITIVSKKKIKVFYKSKEDCIKNNDSFSENDICNETFFVNRFDGLRENSKKIYLNLKKFPKIKIVNNQKTDFSDFDYVIPCWGYFKKIPIINNKIENFNIDCNSNFNLVYNSETYESIFLLGLASNPKVNITQTNFTKSIDGIWFYYHIISDQLYKNLL